MKQLDLILIDSFQEEDYQHCPFLSRLKKQGCFAGELRPIIGYQQHLASLFSGCWPQEIEVWNTFKFSPQDSIFKWTRPLAHLRFFDSKFSKYFIDFVSYFFANINDMLAVQIPIKIMNNFDIILRQPITTKNCLIRPTIFDLIRSAQMSFSYFKGGLQYTDKSNNFLSNLKHLSSRTDALTLRAAMKDSSDFKFIYLMQLDGIKHKFGLDSAEAKNKLKEIDGLLQKYLENSNRPFMIISDHGMVEVKENIDIVSRLGSLGFVLGRDYLVFLESVIARFWFFNKRAREKIIDALREIKQGHILDEKEKQEFGIDFKNNKFGDLFFVLDPGKIIIPNYYQIKEGIKAMHGYLPQFNQGIFLTNLEIKSRPAQAVNFIDIMPIITDFFGLANI